MAGDLIIDKVAATSVATKTSLMRGLAKAWINFNGQGTVATRDSFNIALLVDQGTGDYSIVPTASMSNGSYNADALSDAFISQNNVTSPDGTQFRMYASSGGSAADRAWVYAKLTGNLA